MNQPAVTDCEPDLALKNHPYRISGGTLAEAHIQLYDAIVANSAVFESTQDKRLRLIVDPETVKNAMICEGIEDLNNIDNILAALMQVTLEREDPTSGRVVRFKIFEEHFYPPVKADRLERLTGESYLLWGFVLSPEWAKAAILDYEEPEGILALDLEAAMLGFDTREIMENISADELRNGERGASVETKRTVH